MLSDAQRQDVGAVGVKLLYPKGGGIQHAGIMVGVGGSANNIAVDSPLESSIAQTLSLNLRREVSAVTAACLMISRDKYNEVGGFDEKDFAIYFNDVDLCLKLLDKGYYNIFNPNVHLIHYESKSLGRISAKSSDQMKKLLTSDKIFKNKWRKYVQHDPYYNDNFSRRTATPFELRANRDVF